MRGKGRDDVRAMQDEGAAILAALPRDTHVIALDGGGKTWSSEELADQLARWRMSGRDLAFLIGGPDGHAPEVLARAEQRWSLGPLTLPHMLVRLVVAEQLYRAATMLAGHPYHRA
jgi:23S rRNA (pseudouridine1915-N3)-methyltransferase